MVMVRQSSKTHTLLCIILLRQAPLAVRGQTPILCFTFIVLIGPKMLKMISRLDRFWVALFALAACAFWRRGVFDTVGFHSFMESASYLVHW